VLLEQTCTEYHAVEKLGQLKSFGLFGNCQREANPGQGPIESRFPELLERRGRVNLSPLKHHTTDHNSYTHSIRTHRNRWWGLLKVPRAIDRYRAPKRHFISCRQRDVMGSIAHPMGIPCYIAKVLVQVNTAHTASGVPWTSFFCS